MNTIEMLEECKKRLEITSDYALAKALEIKQARITAYRSGKEHPDIYVCFKIAEILEISPSKVIARVEALNQKNPSKALFFQRFFMIAALWITLGFASALYSPTSEAALMAGSPAVIDLTTHYAKC